MKQILYKLFEHQYLGRDEARTILQNIAQGKYNDVQVASLIRKILPADHPRVITSYGNFFSQPFE